MQFHTYIILIKDLEDDFDQVTGLKTALLDQGNPSISNHLLAERSNNI